MKNNKNLWIGLGVLVVIIAIILAVTLGGKKKDATVPEVITPAPVTTTKTTAPEKSVNTSVLKMSSPVAGSTLKRGSTVSVIWTGPEKCYDLGYVLRIKETRAFNLIGEVCKTNTGVFNYKWLVPLNVVTGTYSLELRKSGSMEHGADVVSFLLK